MKFFTREWHSGGMPEGEAVRVQAEYAAHIEALKSSLPEDVLLLVNEVSLHDGAVQNLVSTGRELTLVLRAENQVGEFDARLRYENCAAPKEELAFLEQAAEHPRVVLLYNEFVRLDGSWIHRMLFWPCHEVTLEFTSFSLETINLPSV
jgi:hypothetical protein